MAFQIDLIGYAEERMTKSNPFIDFNLRHAPSLKTESGGQKPFLSALPQTQSKPPATTRTCRTCQHWKPTLGPYSGLGTCHSQSAKQARYQESTRSACIGYCQGENATVEAEDRGLLQQVPEKGDRP